MATTILYEDRTLETEEARADDAGLWLPFAAVAEATGWEQKPEGICRGDVCVAIPPGREGTLLRDGAQPELNLTEFAQLIVRARDGARARNQWDVSDMHEDQAPLEPVAQYSGEGYGPRSSGRAVNSADNRRCNHVDLLAPLACPWLSSCAMGRGLHVR